MEATAPSLRKCTICLSEITPEAELIECPTCSAAYHVECWAENGGCGIYGCADAPVVEPRSALEIPASHWGRTHKECPSCGKSIAAAALRCRACGATFESATPVDTDAFQERSSQAQKLAGLRRMAALVFILSAIPCSAPLGVIIGVYVWLRHKEALKALPSFHGALVKIGVGIGLVEIAVIAFFSLVQGSLNAY